MKSARTGCRKSPPRDDVGAMAPRDDDGAGGGALGASLSVSLTHSLHFTHSLSRSLHHTHSLSPPRGHLLHIPVYRKTAHPEPLNSYHARSLPRISEINLSFRGIKCVFATWKQAISRLFHVRSCVSNFRSGSKT